MIDIDHFKQFNDRNGHTAGDRLLRACALAWRSHLRPSDTLARCGGEEFAVLLPDCSLDDATSVLERLRTATPPRSHGLCRRGGANARGGAHGCPRARRLRALPGQGHRAQPLRTA